MSDDFDYPEENLDCPCCGGSGHVDDVKQVSDKMPPRHQGRFRVYRDGIEPFDASVCYGMHKPWWVPRNAFTKDESPPIDMLETDRWQAIQDET